MDRDVKNKVVVVTGGADGLGYAIGESFLQNGAKVLMILDVNETKGAETTNTFNTKYGDDKAIFIKCDVTTDLEAIYAEVIEKYKSVDVLVNNAGIPEDERRLRKTFEINLIALTEWSMKFWEHMRTDKGGRGGTIINMSSIYGYVVDQYLPIYKATKYGVVGFTKTLGHEYNYNKFGVRVIALCPGFTRTSFRSYPTMLHEEFQEFKKSCSFQEPEVVGKAAVEIFEKVDSGTAWSVADSKPIEQV